MLVQFDHHVHGFVNARADIRANRAVVPEIGASSVDGIRVDDAFGSDTNDNPIIEAHYEVANRIRSQATDDFARDMGIIAASQLALHYWIASFGTLRAYAKRADLSQTQQEMNKCLEEAEQADKTFTDLAIQMMEG